jgi:hypothetical protein
MSLKVCRGCGGRLRWWDLLRYGASAQEDRVALPVSAPEGLPPYSIGYIAHGSERCRRAAVMAILMADRLRRQEEAAEAVRRSERQRAMERELQGEVEALYY